MVRRVLFHGAVLAAGAIAAVVAGFAFYKVIAPRLAQIPVQATAGAAFLLSGYFLAAALTARWGGIGERLPSRREAAAAVLSSVLFTPLLFYPLHFLYRGYVAAFSNVLALWAFAVPAAAAAVIVAGWLLGYEE